MELKRRSVRPMAKGVASFRGIDFSCESNKIERPRKNRLTEKKRKAVFRPFRKPILKRGI
jgi:hypothetical protein